MLLFEKISSLILRVSIGWMFFYAGITKVLDPSWTAAGYLGSAKTFTGFYAFLASPDVLPLINLVNEWGLLFIGLSLILGLFTRTSSMFGVVLMILYYLPLLDFPYPNEHSFIVDEHIIYAGVLLYFAAVGIGKSWGLDKFLPKLSS